MGEVARSTADRQFQSQVRGLLQPCTSMLFLVVDRVAPDTAITCLRRYGGTVLTPSLSRDQERELHTALRGEGQPVAVSASGSWPSC